MDKNASSLELLVLVPQLQPTAKAVTSLIFLIVTCEPTFCAFKCELQYASKLSSNACTQLERITSIVVECFEGQFVDISSMNVQIQTDFEDDCVRIQVFIILQQKALVAPLYSLMDSL